MYYLILCLSMFITSAVANAMDCPKGKNCDNQKIATKIDKDLPLTLDEKLKKYDESRTNKVYQDKYGVSIQRNIDSHTETENPALNDQIKKSKDFKKVYEGPKAVSKGDNLGFKFAIPLERDK